jgi:hypothetical protein
LPAIASFPFSTQNGTIIEPFYRGFEDNFRFKRYKARLRITRPDKSRTAL